MLEFIQVNFEFFSRKNSRETFRKTLAEAQKLTCLLGISYAKKH